MLKRLAENLAKKLKDAVASRRKPDFIIGPPEDPYMLRWWVVPRNKFFNVYLHKFLKSDSDEALHDHPWANFSFLLEGSYLEHTVLAGGVNQKVRYDAGALKFRRASTAHRVELIDGRPTWSLFVTGPVVREWGFHCPKGWKPWKEYVQMRDGGNQTGKGCEG